MSGNSEVVERVAEAIFWARVVAEGWELLGPYGLLTDEVKAANSAIARAAIEALLEPTPHAIEAIKATVARQTKGFHLSNDFAAEIWREALSPSLKEQETDMSEEPDLIETLARMWAEVDPNRQPIDCDEPLDLPRSPLHGRPTWEWYVPRAEASIVYLEARGFVVERKNAESV